MIIIHTFYGVSNASYYKCGLMECNGDRAYRISIFRCIINCFHMLEIDSMAPNSIPFFGWYPSLSYQRGIGKG